MLMRAVHVVAGQAMCDTIRERDASHATTELSIPATLFSCGATQVVKDTVDQTDWYIIRLWDSIRCRIREIGVLPSDFWVLPS